MSFKPLETYNRKKDNDLTLGPVFEDLAVLNMFLTLREDQALAREIDEPTKFDDVVIRVQNGDHYEYSFHQLKHKDTVKNSDQSITWNDLLGNDKKNAFCLKEYFESYMKLNRRENEIKELSITTTVGFKSQQCAENKLSDLKYVMANLDSFTKKPHGPKPLKPKLKTKYYVTEKDLESYFEECARGVDDTNCAGKRYGFSEQGVQEVKKFIPTPHTKELETFLRLLVFDVNQPHIHKLKEINQAILKLYFPFHWDVTSQDSCFDEIRQKVLQLFRPLVEENYNTSLANWATTEHRRSLFTTLRPVFKEKLALGSKRSYETEILTNLFKELKLEQLSKDELKVTSPWALPLEEALYSSRDNRQPLDVLNIYSNNSNATVITLKLFSFLVEPRKGGDAFQEKAVIIQVEDEEGIQNVLRYFEKLSAIVAPYKSLDRETFCCIIEVSPIFTASADVNEKAKDLAIRLVSLSDLRKWIQFVIVTQSAIQTDGVQNMEDTPLKWEQLSEGAREHLMIKPLFIENLISTCHNSLSTLGFEKTNIGQWMNESCLAELMIHDKRMPLRLGFPKHEPALESNYFKRKIQLPHIKTNNMNNALKNRINFCQNGDTEAFTFGNEYDYLFQEMELEKHKEKSPIYLLAKSKPTANVLELKNYMIKSRESDIEIEDLELLEDKTFGTGSDGKLLIILDLPGKGKTTLVSMLCNQFSKTENKPIDRLLLRANFLEIKRSAWQRDSELDNEQSAIEFMLNSALIDDGTDDCTLLSKAIMKNKCLMDSSGPSVYVVLDGLDEINRDQRNVAVSVASNLLKAKGIKRIIMTSRPDDGLEHELENHFKVFGLGLKGLDEQDQIKFLVKQWSTKLEMENANSCSKGPIEEFAKSLIAKAKEAFQPKKSSAQKSSTDKQFIDIPLQCFIFSECFYSDLKQCLEQSQQRDEPSYIVSSRKFELLNLFDQFYSIKIEILFKNKGQIIEENAVSMFMKEEVMYNLTQSLARLSIFCLVKPIEDAEILIGCNWKSYKQSGSFYQDFSGAARLGVLSGFNTPCSADGLQLSQVTFIHKTLAEYFIAKHFVNCFVQKHSELLDANFLSERSTPTIETFTKTFDKIFIEDSYASIRRLLDAMITALVPSPSVFADENRDKLFEKWPAIRHENFNNRLAEFVKLKNSKILKSWLAKDTGKLDANIRPIKDLQEIEKLFEKDGSTGLIGMLRGYGDDKMPSTILMLIHCLKEYACRSNTSTDDRLELVYSMMITTLVWVSKNPQPDDNRKRIIKTLFHWFDRPKESKNDEVNNVLSNCFFKLVYTLIDILRDGEFKKEALVWLREMLPSHLNDPKYDTVAETLDDAIEPGRISWNKYFEEDVAVYSMLILRNDEQEAPVNVVLRVWNGNHHATQDSDACLTWNDLLTLKESDLSIPFYFKTLSQLTPRALTDVEVALVTSCNLVKERSGGVTDLDDLARQLLDTTGADREAKDIVTGDDLKLYFTECNNDSSTWRPPSSNQKSYRFTQKAIDAISKGTQRAAKFDSSAYEKFLGLLVLRVSMPHAEELQKINQILLKAFLPLYKNLKSVNYRLITNEFINRLFKQKQDAGGVKASDDGSAAGTTKRFAKCTAIEVRSQVLNYLSDILKERNSIDAGRDCELEVVTQFCEKFNIHAKSTDLLWNCVEISDSKTAWKHEKPLKVVNIYGDESNATMMLTFNIISTFKDSYLYKKHKWCMLNLQVTEEEASTTSIVKHFEELNQEVSEYKNLINVSFCCIIEVSPFSLLAKESNEQVKKMIRDLTGLSDIRRWIQFVVVTQSQIVKDRELNDLLSTTGTPLKWHDLPEDSKRYLFSKTLYLDGGKQTSLQKLGFKEDTIGKWLHPNALAELIIHVQEKPLSLGLPKKDSDIETDYIEHEIQLPLVQKKTRGKSVQKFVYTEKDYNEECHLLTRAISKRYEDVFLWVKSKKSKGILELKDCVIKSKYSDVTVHESQLLEDNVNFGTGSKDNKLLVVVDYPGKGKSWLLNSLSNGFLDSWESQSSHPLLWRVDLLRITEWNSYQAHNFIDFLYHSLALGTHSDIVYNNLSFSIVKEKCLNASEPCVFVLLDGFDGISNEHRQITLRMIDGLLNARGIKRVILTSQPEDTLENELEQRFGQFSLHLKNFDKQDQIKYLMKRWKADLKERIKSEGSKKKVKNFVKALVNYAAKALEDEKRTFLEKPLQCMILSTCFFAQLEQYLDNKSPINFADASFKLLSLYDRYFDVKFDGYYERSANLQSENERSFTKRDELKDRFLNSLMRISIFYLVKELDDAQLLSGLSWDSYRTDKNVQEDGKSEASFSEDLKIAMNVGLVERTLNRKSPPDLGLQNVSFIHHTFAEYFVASYIASNLKQARSKLFDHEASPVIIEKILVAPEYAGVRRFLDRMLAENLPPSGELCPFSKEIRPVVLTKRPVIGHEKLNERLADFIILQFSEFFQNCPEGKLEKLNLNDTVRLYLTPPRERENKPRVGLAGILHGHGDRLPSITSAVIHCVKEYACRENTPKDRVKLAASMALMSLVYIDKHRPTAEDKRKGIIASLFHWFDRANGLPTETNDMFSAWFFKLLNGLIGDARNDGFNLEALTTAFEMLKYHRGVSSFKKDLETAIINIFETNEIGENKADQFSGLELELFSYAFPGKNCKLFERILDVLSELNCPETTETTETTEFKHIANWFLDKLSQNTQLLKEEPGLLDRLLTSGRNEIYYRFLANLSNVEKYLVHPIVFDKTMEVLKQNVSKLPATIKIERLVDSALGYINKIQQLLFVINFETDNILLSTLRKKILRTPQDEDIAYLIIGAKVPVLSIIFWYFLLTVKIIAYLSDNGNEGKEEKLMTDIFFSEIGQKILTAFVHAGCCCQCDDGWWTGLGVHFPHEMFHLEETRKTFAKELASNLKLVWQEKGENAFIDFLFKEITTLPSDNDASHDEKPIEDLGEDLGENTSKPNNPLTEIQRVLKGLHRAKLPCLLFSDLVSEYIPKELSPTGLKHLTSTLQETPLHRCQRSSFTDNGDFPRIAGNEKSLWDAIMDEDQTEISRCDPKFERIKALQEKLRQAT